MRWVTYLSPSGGERRPGVVDDGCVFGCPGTQGVLGLLAAGGDAMAAAHRRALADPVEVIVEFETRLCAPLVPAEAVTVRGADSGAVRIDPDLVRGTDDGAVIPPGERGLVVDVGAAAFPSDAGETVGCTLACLWRTPGGEPTALTLGPALVTAEEFDGAGFAVTVSVGDRTVARARLDRAWAAAVDGAPIGSLPARTGPLAAGEELFVDGGPLGCFELRVGSGTGT